MKPAFERVALIGIGLIGSSLARAIKRGRLARTLVAYDRSAEVRARVKALKLVDHIAADAGAAAEGADLVVICAPMRSFKTIGRAIDKHVKPGAIVSDVGSVKRSALADLRATIPAHAHVIPAHPVAGTENSGPDAGFADLFKGRWCILTPAKGTPKAAVAKLAALWKRCGMKIAVMDAEHHDRVLAITSHVPHLIAYTIVNTVADLETHMKGEVITFAASGFRDFTRVAASDPVMWRDVFLTNRDAVLEMLGRLYEDIALLQKAIRNGDGGTLQRVFTRSRAIRRSIVQAKQD